jgi:single-strand DNA-binding protein
MSYNKISIIGHLGQDPELRYTPQGLAVCNFSVATSDKRRDKNGNLNEVTVWFRVTAWGKQAENASKYLSKGRPVYIEGRLGIEEWTDRNGEKRTTLEVNANEIQYLGDGNSSSPRRETSDHDQRRSGPDETERSQDDALPLGSTNKDLPF